jgi:hypothetical protein
MILWAGGTQGPVAVPGTYTVRMKANGATQTQTFKVVKDPRSKATQADLEQQFAFLMKVRDETSKANDAIKLVRNIRSQIADRTAKLPENKRESFRTAASGLLATLTQSEEKIYQTKNRSGQDPLNYPIRLNNKIAALAGVAASADARPTDQTLEVYRALSAQLEAEIARIRSALSQSLPALNRELAASNVAAIVESTAEEPSTNAVATPGDGEEDIEH